MTEGRFTVRDPDTSGHPSSIADANNKTLKLGVEAKSKEFVEESSEVYTKACIW